MLYGAHVGSTACLVYEPRLTLAELHVFVLRSFINFYKAPTNFDDALTKPYNGLVEILL